MLDGLQPQQDYGALSVGALARFIREERQRAPDRDLHLVLDDAAAEAVSWAGGVAWCRSVGATQVSSLNAGAAGGDDALCVVVTNDAKKAQQYKGACVLATAPAFAAPFWRDDDTLPCVVTLANASDAFPVRPWEAPAQWRAADLSPKRRQGLKDVATALAALCEDLKIDASSNVWALGATSRVVGAAVEAQLSAGGRRAALILLDRTADLSVIGAPSECTLERVLAHAPGPLLSAAAALTKTYALPWSLQAADRHLLRRLIAAETHDAALDLLNAFVAERLRRDGLAPPPPKKRGRGAELAANLEALTSMQVRRATHAFDAPAAPLRDASDVVPLGIAVVEGTQRTAKRRTSLEDVLSLDKLLGNLIEHSHASLLECADVISETYERPQTSLSASDAACALVRCLARTRNGADAAAARVARAVQQCADAEDRDAALFVLGLVGVLASTEPPSCAGEAPTLVGRVVQAVLQGSEDALASCNGSLASLGAAALGSLSETVGLGGVFGKAKAAVARTRRRAGDGGALVVVVVLGGLTFAEIRDANAVLRELGARDRVVLGGTRLCTGQDAAEAMFFVDDDGGVS